MSIFDMLFFGVFLLFGRALQFLLVLLLPWAFDPAIDCLDNGGVWDGAAARCRCDCLTWNEKDGCVPLPDGMAPDEMCVRFYE